MLWLYLSKSKFLRFSSNTFGSWYFMPDKKMQLNILVWNPPTNTVAIAFYSGFVYFYGQTLSPWDNATVKVQAVKENE